MYKPLAPSLLRICSLLLAASVLAAAVSPSLAQTSTAFTYQGKLTGTEGAPVSGPAKIRFQLFSAAQGGASVAGPVTLSGVPVTDGLFAAEVDFGPVFQSGRGGWIEFAVIDPQGNATVLSPRQKITPAPLASGIAGLTLVAGQTVTDVDNSASPVDSSIWGGGGTSTAYLSFVAGTTGPLAGITLRYNTGGVPTLFATVYNGVGTSGTALGSISRFMSPTGIVGSEVFLDLSTQNIQVTAGQAYSVSILCGASFSSTNAPAAGTSGVRSDGAATNWWFRTGVRPIGPTYAAAAGSAATASLATLATNATTALSLSANATSNLGDNELRLRGVSDSNHGLGYFGDSQPFRNTGFLPNGPVLFGAVGGGLGTSNEGDGRIALRWNNIGQVVIAGQVGIGVLVSTTGYRLELPNAANPGGRGRANAWVTYSSRELKQNIETLTDPLETINRLRGVSFDWKQPNPDGTHTHDMGFIAEEVAAVLPELVTETTEGNATGLDYGRIVPLTVEAIKQQQATINSLRLDAAKRENENAELRSRLAAIEAALAKMSTNNK